MNASTISTAIPSFFIALLLAFFLGFQWELFPAYTDQNMVSSFSWNWESIQNVAYNAALPVLSGVIGGIISYAQSTRNSVIAVSNENFIITAKAKGVSNQSMIYKHTLRNASFPCNQPWNEYQRTDRRSVVTEQIFNWNGVGTLFLEANNTNDYPLMMGIMIFLSGFALVANLVTDLCYSLLDPRVTLGEKR